MSLSDSIYGQNYLTASVTATNTGNIGTKVRIRVFWPLQGFPSVKRTKVVRVGAGGNHEVQFRAPITEQQVSQFQNEQLASSDGNPCHYRASIIDTYGTAH